MIGILYLNIVLDKSEKDKLSVFIGGIVMSQTNSTQVQRENNNVDTRDAEYVCNQKKDKLFFVDAECDGLYGKFITVAGMIIDREGKEIDRFYYGIQKENLHVESEWVRDNVLPKLGNYTGFPNERELLEAFWEKWIMYQKDAYAIGDVIYPVECRLFQKCVEINEAERSFLAPYPLLDLASVLYAQKIDPLSERTKLSGCMQNAMQHNALFDIEMMAEIWKRLRMQK